MTQRILTDWLESYLKFVESDEPPELFKLWTGLSTIAAVLKRKVFWDWGRYTAYPNMYVILVAPPGIGKGRAMTPCEDLLEDISIEVGAHMTSKEGLVKALALTFSNSADGSIGGISMDCALTIMHPEIVILFKGNDKELVRLLCELWDCKKKVPINFVTRDYADLTNVWLNILGGTTPWLLANEFPEEVISGGFGSRSIFVYANRKSKSVPFPFLSEEEKALRKQLVSDLAVLSNVHGEFTATKECLELLGSFYIENDHNPKFSSRQLEHYNPRRVAHMQKLCMILSASRSSNLEITTVDFHRALSILETTEEVMPRVFEGVGRSDLAGMVATIQSFLMRRNQCTKGELLEEFKFDIDGIELDKILYAFKMRGVCEAYTENGLVTYVYVPKGDRK